MTTRTNQRASDFQSAQYRTVEFLLGNKNAEMPESSPTTPRRRRRSPPRCSEFHPGLLPVLKDIYDSPDRHWEAYETCEELVDIEESFQPWRFRHLKTVSRIIGFKRGTGGSSGVAFLKAALNLAFFPEILSVRTEIG